MPRHFRQPGSISIQTRLGLAAALALATGGCITPRGAVKDADKTAYRIIAEKQQSALGKVEAFTLERPEDELRRRLMIEQQLPAGGYASFGRAYLPPVRKQPRGVSQGLPLPAEAQVVGGPSPQVRGLYQETLATDLFLLDIGRDPSSGAMPASYPVPDLDPDLMAVPAEVEIQRPVLTLTLLDALQVAARNSRDYQREKEQVFLAALDLDLERDRFEFRFSGTIDAEVATELEGQDTTGVVLSPALGINKLFKSGALITSRIGLDLAKLLTGDKSESLGFFADASITIPLLRGAGVEVVTENLHQAERDVIYAIWDFETFKRDFAVQIVGDYLAVLGDLNNVDNSEATYRRLLGSAERSEQLAAEGRLPNIQVDQAIQQALRARERVLLSRQRYDSRLDNFKLRLGLPPDARVALDPAELERLLPLAEAVLGEDAAILEEIRRAPRRPTTLPTTRSAAQPATTPATQPGPAGDLPPEVRDAVDPSTRAINPQAQPYTTGPSTLPAAGDPSALAGDIPEPSLPDDEAYFSALKLTAIRLALRNRLDLAASYGEVVDAQRRTVVAANGLQADLDLSAGAGYGGRRGALSGGQSDTSLTLGEGSYQGGLGLGLPLERTPERNSYRSSLINLDRAIRTAQEAEDRVKLDVLNSIRSLRVAAEDLRIQVVAIQTARRRVEAANLLIELGRGQVRDLTEAEESLVTAQNSFTGALVDYRVAQLELQRDLGVLEVDEEGLFQETAANLALP